MKVYGTLDDAGLELLASDPTDVFAGRVYFNYVTKRIRIYDGVAGAWHDILKTSYELPIPESSNNDFVLKSDGSKLVLASVVQALPPIVSGDGRKIIQVNSTEDGVEYTTQLKTDTITEHTEDSGVTIEGVLIKDSDITLDSITPSSATKSAMRDKAVSGFYGIGEYSATYGKKLASTLYVPERGIYVGVGYDTYPCSYSTDGLIWNRSPYTVDVLYNSVCYSPSLGIFCAVAGTGTSGSKRVAITSNLYQWDRYDSVDNTAGWYDVCWSSELGLFCAVSGISSINRVMTSPDGITWTGRTATSNGWNGICWSPELELFCAVATSGTLRVMTSPDGITWTDRTSADETKGWYDVCWSSELGLFCAVGQDKTMTSEDGITWTEGDTIPSGYWKSICWSPELGLFCAVGGTNAITSPDGITWTERTLPISSSWTSVSWSSDLGIFLITGNAESTYVITSTRVNTKKFIND